MAVKRPISIPSNRLSRFGHLGVAAGGIAGNIALHGLMELGKGTRPRLRDLVLTPNNFNLLTNQLAKLRGAAMKIGQLISMDTGDFLPPDLALIMGRLRESADNMPSKQLKKVLNEEWPKNWLHSFENFNIHPIAAASIGQVHQAKLKDGRDLAIKVQYPGVRESIESDIKNVAILIKMSGLLPDGFVLAPYLEEAKQQLQMETDYENESCSLKRFGSLLAKSQHFVVPKVHQDWSTSNILAMDYMKSMPIEDTFGLPQKERNNIAQQLIELTLCEVFDFGLMQTDPNFANYRFQPDSKKIVLLDFGATRDIASETIKKYYSLLSAGFSGDETAIMGAAEKIGFFDTTISNKHYKIILRMMRLVFGAVSNNGLVNLCDPTLARRLHADGLNLIKNQFVPPPLPIEVLLMQRKFGGIFLLCSRLNASVNITKLLTPYIDC